MLTMSFADLETGHAVGHDYGASSQIYYLSKEKCYHKWECTPGRVAKCKTGNQLALGSNTTLTKKVFLRFLVMNCTFIFVATDSCAL